MPLCSFDLTSPILISAFSFPFCKQCYISKCLPWDLPTYTQVVKYLACQNRKQWKEKEIVSHEHIFFYFSWLVKFPIQELDMCKSNIGHFRALGNEKSTLLVEDDHHPSSFPLYPRACVYSISDLSSEDTVEKKRYSTTLIFAFLGRLSETGAR